MMLNAFRGSYLGYFSFWFEISKFDWDINDCIDRENNDNLVPKTLQSDYTKQIMWEIVRDGDHPVGSFDMSITHRLFASVIKA